MVQFSDMEGEFTDLKQALVWLCAALRRVPVVPSPEAASLVSNTEQTLGCRILNVQLAGFALQSFEHFDWTTTSSKDDQCWRHIFKSSVVVPMARPLPAPLGRGARMTFDLMIHLAAVESWYRIDGGSIFVGFFTALIPMGRDKHTGSIQWHFESTTGVLDPRQLQSIRGDWYKFDHLSPRTKLRSSSCFVGWYQRACIMLGTKELQSEFGWSGVDKTRHKTAHKEGCEGAMQLGFSVGPINFNPQFTSTYRLYSNVPQFTSAIRRHLHSVIIRVVLTAPIGGAG